VKLEHDVPAGWRCTHTDNGYQCIAQGVYRPPRRGDPLHRVDFNAPKTCYTHRPDAPSDWPPYDLEHRGVLPGHHCSGCNDPMLTAPDPNAWAARAPRLGRYGRTEVA